MASQTFFHPLSHAGSIPFPEDCHCQFAQTAYVEGFQRELEFEEPPHVLVVLHEHGKLVQKPAEQHYRSTFGTAHPVEEPVKLVDVGGFGRRKEFMGIGNEQYPVLDGRNVLVEVRREFIPIRGIHCHRLLLHHP